MIYACGPEPMLEAVRAGRSEVQAAVAGVGRASDGMRHGRLLQLRDPGSRRTRIGITTSAPASPAPCSTAKSIVTGIDQRRVRGTVAHSRRGDPVYVGIWDSGFGVWDWTDLLSKSDRSACESAHRGERLLRLRRRIRAKRSTSSTLGGVAVKGLFLDGARRPSAARASSRRRPAC